MFKGALRKELSIDPEAGAERRCNRASIFGFCLCKKGDFAMKSKPLVYPVLFSLVLVLSSCGGRDNSQPDMHAQHDSLADNFAHKDIVILDAPYQLSAPAEAKMEEVIIAYLQLKAALVKDDENAADTATELIAAKVAAVVPTELDGKGLEAWHNHQTLYEVKLKEMRHTEGLENKRSYFSHLSEITYCMIKSFGLKRGELFAVFCPMAFDRKGAYWISGSKEIQNPYFGQTMPKCGEIKEEL